MLNKGLTPWREIGKQTQSHMEQTAIRLWQHRAALLAGDNIWVAASHQVHFIISSFISWFDQILQKYLPGGTEGHFYLSNVLSEVFFTKYTILSKFLFTHLSGKPLTFSGLECCVSAEAWQCCKMLLHYLHYMHYLHYLHYLQYLHYLLSPHVQSNYPSLSSPPTPHPSLAQCRLSLLSLVTSHHPPGRWWQDTVSGFV